MNAAALRESLRPHGRVASDCDKCLHFADCGGIEPELNLFNTDCVQANCCRPWGPGTEAGAPDCDNVCPNNPKYLELLREVGGLSFHDLPAIPQAAVDLPRYIPLIYRRYVRKLSVNWPMVALDTYEVVKLEKDRMETVSECPDSLRRTFGLAPGTAVMLRGVADDRPLERYWSYRRRDCIPQRLERFGVSLAVGPNFSHFLDVPRHDNLFNRKRQLLCLAEFVEAGLNPVPHLNAAQPGDWRFWGRFLAENPSITVVAVEFETGNRSRAEGARAVRELVNLQQSTGRRLHPLVIGGTQFLERIATDFLTGTFVDSTPFMKTVHRQSFLSVPPTGKHRWRKSPTAPAESLDKLLAHNLPCYSDWLDMRWVAIAGEIVRIPSPQRLPLKIAAS
jgi:Domain of unknown function (DUF4417)